MTLDALDIPSPLLTRTLVRITTDQYHQMIEKGILAEDAGTELLNGMIVHKDRSDNGEDPMSHGPLHRLSVRLLIHLAARIDSPQRHLQVQLPVHISTLNEPEPDAAVILGSDRAFADRLPTAAETACVLEVARSSLERDSENKLPTYALAGIPQYILINLRAIQVEVYTQPAGNAYRAKEIVVKGRPVRISLGAGEFLEVDAAELLP